MSMLSALKFWGTKVDPDYAAHASLAGRKAMHTPDVSRLQQNYAWNVFIYDSIQKGQPKHNLVDATAIELGAGYTEKDSFVMFKKKLGIETFPFAMEVREDQKMGMSSLIGDPRQVMGRVYAMRPENIIKLDEHLLNLVYYERKRVPVLIPYQERVKGETTFSDLKVKKLDCFMYVARPEFWEDQISSSEAGKLFGKVSSYFPIKKWDNQLGAYYFYRHDLEANSR